MRILIQGIPDWDPTRQFGCTSCGCVFEADSGEYSFLQRDGYVCICPCCGRNAKELPTDTTAKQNWIETYSRKRS